MTRALAFVIVFALASLVTSGQEPTFEVVSIKRNSSGAPGPLWGGTPRRWAMINGPVASLIWTAYEPDVFELPGAPPWVHSDRYDVIATMNGNRGREVEASMLRALLADRFSLRAHYEMQERAVYALVVSRPGRLGPALKLSSLDCAVADAKCGMSLGGGTLTATGMPLGTISSVGRIDDRVIVDKTGLTGSYDFTLRYSMQPALGEDTPSIFTAVQEQLGLRLVSDTAPLRVIVIDRIERPSED